MATNYALRGADVKVYINDKVYAGVTAFKFNSSTGTRPILGIDSGVPYELAPGTQKVTGSMDVVRIRNGGGLEGGGFAALPADILLSKYFSIRVVDRLSDTVIFETPEASIIDQNWSMPTRGISAGSCSFECIGWANEAS